MSERKMITLATRKQMDIYMNPQRQRLLKALEVSGKPMTPKQLSNVLKISASSVSLHIRKLEELACWSWTTRNPSMASRRNTIKSFRSPSP